MGRGGFGVAYVPTPRAPPLAEPAARCSTSPQRIRAVERIKKTRHEMGRPSCGPPRKDPPSPPDRTARGRGGRRGRPPRGVSTRARWRRGGDKRALPEKASLGRSPSQLDAPLKDRSRRPVLPPSLPRLRRPRVSPSLASRLASLPSSAPHLASCSSRSYLWRSVRQRGVIYRSAGLFVP